MATQQSGPVRSALERAYGESLIVAMDMAQPESIGVGRLNLARAQVNAALADADKLDRELAQLRDRKGVDEKQKNESADYLSLVAQIERLFNPSLETHRINPEGTMIGALVSVLEQVAGRIEACVCYCRPATDADGDSRRRVREPDCCGGTWDCACNEVIVCTRCAALGRVMNRPAQRWE